MPDSPDAERRILNQKSQVEEIHLRACEEGKSFYLDPLTGYQVTTEFEHLKRGKCCRSGCRHCPYGFTKVPRTDG